jgi:hypothetical protein
MVENTNQSASKSLMKDITRSIKSSVERELWARAAGRCQFNGCNRLVYKSPVTQERINLAEKAHVYSFAKEGPRGWGPFLSNRKGLNDIANLLLVCHDCHQTIDQRNSVARYPAERLIAWKCEHEDRVRIVTGIRPNKRSHVILYSGKIGEEESPLEAELAVQAMFPDWYPAEERPINLAMSSEHEDSTEFFWKTEAAHLRSAFERYVRPRIREGNPNHFSVFARASQPLLVLLGTLLTDKIPTEVYQLQREPISWRWQGGSSNDFSFRLVPPENSDGDPALVISASARINCDRVTSVLGGKASIWELTIDQCHNNFLKSRNQLSAFREAARVVLAKIAEAHGQNIRLNIFPAMPVACAVELGRIRMPKADMPWIIYDQNNKVGKFVCALEVGENHD